MLHRSLRLTIVACLVGCGATGEPGASASAHAEPTTSVVHPSATSAAPNASASAVPLHDVAPEGTRYSPALPCEGVGHFDLTAHMTDPRCSVASGDPRLKVWTRSIPAEAGPFAIRLMDATTTLRVQKQGVIELRFELENLGGDTDLIQAEEDALPRIVVTSSAASDVPVGDLLFARRAGWNGWTGVRWRSRAVGELRLRVEARVFKGLAHLAGPGDVRPYVRVEEWLDPGTYALRVEPLGHAAEPPPVGPLGTLVVAP